MEKYDFLLVLLFLCSHISPISGEDVPIPKKLRIGIPVKKGVLDEFVAVERDPQTKKVIATGFCVEVFNRVIGSLPYAVPYEFIPFESAEGEPAGSYDDLVGQIPLGTFDAVVGDITITANRTKYVDFTLPFTESGLSMIVAIKDDQWKNAWIFMKPLTTDVWIAMGFFFLFTGLVVWVLEHRVNSDFRGPPLQQVQTSFWFSFSTLLFAHKTKVASISSRFAVVWVFVALVLTSRYTASLSSMLTVAKLQPTVTDINDVVKNGEYVGYQQGSFVGELLMSMKFDPSKVKNYSTVEEYDEALSKGSSNGGVAAIVDELPYIKIFLKRYCKKYTMVGPTYMSAGFGFAFPKGSPLVPDISRAILSVTEEDKMLQIKREWFGEEIGECTQKNVYPVTSDGLNLDIFRDFCLKFCDLCLNSNLFLVLFLNAIIISIMFVLAKISYKEEESPISISYHGQAEGMFSQDEVFATPEPVNPPIHDTLEIGETNQEHTARIDFTSEDYSLNSIGGDKEDSLDELTKQRLAKVKRAILDAIRSKIQEGKNLPKADLIFLGKMKTESHGSETFFLEDILMMAAKLEAALPDPIKKQKSKEMKKKAKELVQEAHVLKRRIDILHLIFSFPVETQADQKMEFESLCHKFSSINQLVRQLQDSHDYEKIQDLFLEVSKQLDKCESSALSPDPPVFIYTMAIDSAVHQILQYLKHRRFGKIKICGKNADKVAEALKDLPEIKLIFDDVHSIFLSHPSIVELQLKIAEHASKGGQTAKMLMLVNCTDQLTDLYELDLDMPIVLMLILPSEEVNQMWPVDLEIRMEDHLVPWKLFCHNVGKAVHSSTLQCKAARLIEKCHGHLLGIVLLARALKDVTDVNYWELALHELSWLPSPKVNGMSVPLVNVLRFIWERMDDKIKNCIKYYVAHRRKGTLLSSSLICGWISCGAIATEEEGECILAKLTDSFVLESVGEGLVCMAEEVRLVLQNIFLPEHDPAYLKQGDLGLARTPKAKEWNVKEICLMNNQLSELPSNPNCPVLVKLFLQGNLDLMVIPPDFFEHMPMLQVLDLSYTSIKTLPYSISKLNALRKFFLRGCELLVRLPHAIGKLTNLEVFDLEGTELMCLPREIGELVNLTCLKVCFSGDANLYIEEEVDKVIPNGTLSCLPQLNELSIDILPDGDWWNVGVRDIVAELRSLKGLRQLKLYLPAVELLNDLSTSQIYPDLVHFRFTVGHHRQRFISRLPQKVDGEFNNLEKGLKYINGRSISSKISEVLKYANAFFLERHWTLKNLSEFGVLNMDKLKFCVVVECRELRTIIDAEQFYQNGYSKKDNGELEVQVSEFGVENVLPSLQYLSIHYMKTMESICIGTMGKGCLSNLKYLALHTCPNLTILFTVSMLGNLVKLEELIIQDCPKISNLVNVKSSDSTSGHFLPSLKKMSLLQLPELVSITNGLCLGPKLERLVVFYCPKLNLLSKMDILSKDLKVIKGEKEWWDTLMWYESDMSRADQDFLTHKFIPLQRNGHLMTQLTKD